MVVVVVVGVGVLVSVVVAVGIGVELFVDKVVGEVFDKGVGVGAGIDVGEGVTLQAASTKPIDDVPHNLKKSRRVRFLISLLTFCAVAPIDLK